MRKKSKKSAKKISKIETTTDLISSRGGLALFLLYLEHTRLFKLIENYLGKIKGSRKGIALREFLVQIISFIMDGSHRYLSYFDHLKTNDAYAAVLETTRDRLASSHQIKRFFKRLASKKEIVDIFRGIFRELFIWRLKLEKPKYIVLGIDTMVLDNDDAQKREGVEPTYKRKKGFQPLHIIWGPVLADIIFRKGSAHSNHGNDFINSVDRIVKIIRERYSADIPIIIVADSGFFDQKAFAYFEEELKIYYIITGKIFTDIKKMIEQLPPSAFKKYKKGGYWEYVEFGWRYASWKKMRRVVYTSLVADENGQTKFDFARVNSIIVTNIGMDEELNAQLDAAGIGHFKNIKEVIWLSHNRGKDELVHRSFKELATREQLPFKSFAMNSVYYYLQAITHFMFESYKRDVTDDVISITSYPNTFRRHLIDFAAKLVSHSDNITMRVSGYIMNSLKLDQLWKRCQSPPVINFA